MDKRSRRWLALELVLMTGLLTVFALTYAHLTNDAGLMAGTPDMEGVVVVDAFALNSGQVPDHPHHPGLTTTVTQAAVQRGAKALGWVGASDWRDLAEAPSPLVAQVEATRLIRSYLWVWVVLYGLGWWLLWRPWVTPKHRVWLLPLLLLLVLWPTHLAIVAMGARSETPGLAFLSLGWAAWQWGTTGRRRLGWGLAGLLWGLAMLSKMSFLPLIVLAAAGSFLLSVPRTAGAQPRVPAGWRDGWIDAVAPPLVVLAVAGASLLLPYDWATLTFGKLSGLSPIGAALLGLSLLPLVKLWPGSQPRWWGEVREGANAAAWAWWGALFGGGLLWLLAGANRAATELLAAGVQALFWYELREDVTRVVGGLWGIVGRAGNWLQAPPYLWWLVQIAWWGCLVGVWKTGALSRSRWWSLALWGAAVGVVGVVLPRFVWRDAPLFEAYLWLIASVMLGLMGRKAGGGAATMWHRGLAYALGLAMVAQIWAGLPTRSLLLTGGLHNHRPESLLSVFLYGPASQQMRLVHRRAYRDGQPEAESHRRLVDSSYALALTWPRWQSLWTSVLPNRRVSSRDVTVWQPGAWVRDAAGEPWHLLTPGGEGAPHVVVAGHRLTARPTPNFLLEHFQYRVDHLRMHDGETDPTVVLIMQRADGEVSLWVKPEVASALGASSASQPVVWQRRGSTEQQSLVRLSIDRVFALPVAALGDFWLVSLREVGPSESVPWPPLMLVPGT